MVTLFLLLCTAPLPFPKPIKSQCDYEGYAYYGGHPSCKYTVTLYKDGKGVYERLGRKGELRWEWRSDKTTLLLCDESWDGDGFMYFRKSELRRLK